jgi:hypothetical protein
MQAHRVLLLDQIDFTPLPGFGKAGWVALDRYLSHRQTLFHEYE